MELSIQVKDNESIKEAGWNSSAVNVTFCSRVENVLAHLIQSEVKLSSLVSPAVLPSVQTLCP